MDITRIATLSPSKQKRAFDALMVKGWKDAPYVRYLRERETQHGEVGYCALGAAGRAAGNTWDVEVFFPALREEGRIFGNELVGRIAEASNAAGSKEAAIAAVKAISWSR